MIVSSCKKDEEEMIIVIVKSRLIRWQVKYTLDGVTSITKKVIGEQILSPAAIQGESWVLHPIPALFLGFRPFSWDGVSFIDIDRGT
ncbi:MAG: hypothetical protein R2759_08395 [Bacteroidales bacterium]